MSKQRRKISAVVKDFDQRINSLRRLDSDNQDRFTTGNLTKEQLHLLTESVFFNGFREYENFIRDIFLLYCQGKKSINGKKARSYLSPKSFTHTEELIQSALPFLDWSSGDQIITRSELYLKDGYPVKLPLTTYKLRLTEFKRIRNHIAHNSTKSLNDYIKVIRSHYRTTPLIIPTPGEFLLQRSRTNSSIYKLLEFLNMLQSLSDDLTNI